MLYNLIDDIYLNVLHKDNKEKKLITILEEMGITDTVMFVDNRIIKLIDLYTYYSSNATPPAKFKSTIWYDTVITLEQHKPRLI